MQPAGVAHVLPPLPPEGKHAINVRSRCRRRARSVACGGQILVVLLTDLAGHRERMGSMNVRITDSPYGSARLYVTFSEVACTARRRRLDETSVRRWVHHAGRDLKKLQNAAQDLLGGLRRRLPGSCKLDTAGDPEREDLLDNRPRRPRRAAHLWESPLRALRRLSRFRRVKWEAEWIVHGLTAARQRRSWSTNEGESSIIQNEPATPCSPLSGSSAFSNRGQGTLKRGGDLYAAPHERYFLRRS